MTPKELLYIEDALSHESFVRTQCDDCAGQLQDSTLKSFVSQLSTKHKKMFDQFFTTVKG
ncbi:MAG: hypothetical protein A2Y17_11785 [Clostridiales bacterium GWF2_38_85]|nr:MAG: hypothetical protein A2Y17_11785 [Clostridiales bacterium GWF2_38_85]HBL85383.1 hypothetical protein [Clostridiales bacterium]